MTACGLEQLVNSSTCMQEKTILALLSIQLFYQYRMCADLI